MLSANWKKILKFFSTLHLSTYIDILTPTPSPSAIYLPLVILTLNSSGINIHLRFDQQEQFIFTWLN